MRPNGFGGAKHTLVLAADCDYTPVDSSDCALPSSLLGLQTAIANNKQRTANPLILLTMLLIIKIQLYLLRVFLTEVAGCHLVP